MQNFCTDPSHFRLPRQICSPSWFWTPWTLTGATLPRPPPPGCPPSPWNRPSTSSSPPATYSKSTKSTRHQFAKTYFKQPQVIVETWEYLRVFVKNCFKCCAFAVISNEMILLLHGSYQCPCLWAVWNLNSWLELFQGLSFSLLLLCRRSFGGQIALVKLLKNV